MGYSPWGRNQSDKTGWLSVHVPQNYNCTEQCSIWWESWLRKRECIPFKSRSRTGMCILAIILLKSQGNALRLGKKKRRKPYVSEADDKTNIVCSDMIICVRNSKCIWLELIGETIKSLNRRPKCKTQLHFYALASNSYKRWVLFIFKTELQQLAYLQPDWFLIKRICKPQLPHLSFCFLLFTSVNSVNFRSIFSKKDT